MSNFEKLFEVVYCVAAIVWSCWLVIDVVTEPDKSNWKHVISVVIMASLTAFILAKISW